MFRENKFFYKFLSQLVVLILIPTIILSVYIQNYVYRRLAENTAELSESYFTIISGYIEDVVENALSSAVYLVADPQVQNLAEHLNRGDTSSVDYLRTQYSVTQQLKTLLDINKSLHSIYLYSAPSGSLLTSDGMLTTLENHYDTGWLPQYEAEAVLSVLPERTSLDSDYPLYVHGKSDTVISLILPVRGHGGNKGSTVAVVNIAKDDLFNATVSDSFSCLIFSKDRQVISAYTTAEMDEALIDEVMDRQSPQNSVVEIRLPGQGEVYNAYYKTMPKFNVVYTIITPMSQIQNTLRGIQVTVLLIMAGSIILCMFLALRIARRYCTPIISMSRDLQEFIPKKTTEDQLHYVTEAVANISLKYREISQTDPDLIGKLFGSAPGGADFENGYFFCTILSIDDYRETVTYKNLEKVHSFKKALIAAAQQRAPQGTVCEGIMLDDDKTLVAYRLEDPPKTGQIEDLLRQSLPEALQGDLSVSIGVGGIYENKGDLTQSYLEALDAVKYRLVLGHRCIAQYEEVVSGRKDRAAEPLKISELIGRLDHEAVCAQLVSYFDDLKSTLLVDSNTLYEYVLPIANDLSHFLANNGISINSVLKGDQPVYMRLLSKDTFDAICALLCDISRSVSELLTHKSDDEAYMNAIAALVDKRYNDPGLDISTIAEETGISYSYVCKIVKDRTKLSFTNYLNRVRIRLAKEQLRETHTSIKQIAESVGYVNDQSFTRYFKKFEGITPGKYRRLHSSDESDT